MKYATKATILYTVFHFLVDFSTVFLISGVILGPKTTVANRGYIIIAYNLIAFAGQLPLGMIADAVDKNRIFAATGCALACIAYPCCFVSPWLACILAALGNGAFHIGAGADVLKMSMPKAGLSGLFVGSGAIGVWLAYKTNSIAAMWFLPFVMLLGFLYFLFSQKSSHTEAVTADIKYTLPRFSVALAVSCFMLTVVLRSLLGMVMNFSWKAIPLLSFIFILAVAGGKALGGFISDKFGNTKTAFVSLASALVLFIFSFDFWIAGVLAVFCFNMTMPLTLTAIAEACDRKYGFAFGLTTFALALGFIPSVFGVANRFDRSMLISGVLLSLIFIMIGYLLLKNNSKRQATDNVDYKDTRL